MENLIEELTKVNPSNLSEEGLKLFKKIGYDSYKWRFEVRKIKEDK